MRAAPIACALLLASCTPTITDDPTRLSLALSGDVLVLTASEPILEARVAIRAGSVESPYCELPDCATEGGVVYLDLPPGEYGPVLPVATVDDFGGAAALAKLEGERETLRANLPRP